MSELALKLIKEAKEKRLTRLDLGNCGLTELPYALFDEFYPLPWLEELILSDVWEEYDFEKTEWRDFKSQNHEMSNNIRYIPPHIGVFKRLKKIIIGNRGGKSELEDISSLKVLSNLLVLNIFHSNVKDLTPLKDLANLKILAINESPISDIKCLQYLNNLWSLDLKATYVEDLNPIKGMMKLEYLGISRTKVEDISPLKKLTNLISLDISVTEVKDLSPIKDLINLKHLDLSVTKVKDISPLKNLTNLDSLELVCLNIQNYIHIVGNLTNLTYLNLIKSNVTDLNFLKNLKNLTTLVAFDTEINDLSPLKGLTKLEHIDIRNTLVNDLLPLKKMLENEIPIINRGHKTPGILVEECHIVRPDWYLADRGNEAILRYWQELENKETITNNQTKLIFVGNSRAGKTSLWQFLKDKIYNEQADSTHGIKTEIWDSEILGTEDNQNLAAHIWDFGGQEYYHATHRLFLADNAVYVLVWEKDNNKPCTRLEQFKLDDDPNGEIEEVDLEHFPASYWFENIQYFAGKHCPVLIVQNKVDKEIQKANYTEGGKNLPDCFHLSVKNAFEFQQGHQELEESNMDFQKFKLRLLKELRKNATAFKLVKYYAQVREALEAKAKDTEYIAVSELKDIALQFDETPDLENLLAYLKSFTNTVLYFPQNDVLKDRLYLNPTHISRDIYKILNKQVRENNGKFDVAHIKTRLNLTDDQEAERFVALMREFDLIFEKQDEEGNREFVTPQYLPEKDNLSKDIQFSIKRIFFVTAFSIQFKSFVPRSLMLRFIANNGVLSDDERYWRNGIIYESPITHSMIKVEYDHNQSTFTICVQDKSTQTIDMQNIVKQFVKLENSDDNIKISNDGKLYVELRTIRKLQHENSRGDIYENGELIPLSKFDWLIKKQEKTMMKEAFNNLVRNHISDGKTDKAFTALLEWAQENGDSKIKNAILALRNQWKDNETESNMGRLSYDDANRTRAKIVKAVLEIADTLEGVNGSQNESESEPIQKPNILSTKLKILMLTANPAGTTKLNLDKEHSSIVLKLESKQDLFTLILKKAVSGTEFKEFAETIKPAILHFSGHGEGGKYAGIVVQNDDKNDEELISIEGLDALFEYLNQLNINIQLVLLNACYSDAQAQIIAKYVPYVIGTNVGIGDGIAIAFSTGFYYKLAELNNLDFGQSFKSGRTQAVMKGASKSNFIFFKDGKQEII